MAWLILLAFAAPAAAQVGPDAGTIRPEQWKAGYNGFAMLCRLNGLLVHESKVDWLLAEPSKRLLIVLGQANDIRFNSTAFLQEGGAMLIATDRDLGAMAPWGVRFHAGPLSAASAEDTFRGIVDCPLVEADPDDANAAHPLRKNWQRLATNRPGALTLLSGMARERVFGLARHPRLRSYRADGSEPWFCAAMESVSSDGESKPQAVFCADQSIFTNQMLTFEDNALFAQQTLRWLADEQRTDVLIIADRRIVNPIQPDRLVLPPPDPRDVIEAMKQLPPQALLEFANLVATTAEDEGIIDELLVDVANEIPRRTLMRALIVGASIFLMLWLLYRLFNRRVDDPRWTEQRSGRRKSTRGAIERRQAVIVLLDQLRSDLSRGSTQTWSEVIEQLSPTPAAHRFRKQLLSLLRQVYQRSLGVWTPAQLTKVERHVRGWRDQVRDGSLSLRVSSSEGLEMISPPQGSG